MELPLDYLERLALGSASAKSGIFSFDQSLTIDAGKTYFAYGDTVSLVGADLKNGYAGGTYYGSYLNAIAEFGAFSAYAGEDTQFTVTGTAVTTAAAVAAVPEPATWGMMILGLGMAGTALRRRRGIATRVARTA